MGWAGHVAYMERTRHTYKILVRKLEWKTPLRRPTIRWEDNIRIDLRAGFCE
jgi:hypothetical protein